MSEIDLTFHMKKYELLYKLTKEGFNEEHERFIRLEDKATRYFTVLSLLLVIAGFIGKVTFDSVIPPKDYIDWLCFATSVFFIVIIICALCSVFSVFKIRKLQRFPMNSEALDYFDNNVYLDAICDLSKSYIKETLVNRKIVEEKTRALTRGYHFIIFAIFLFIALTISLVIHIWTTPH